MRNLEAEYLFVLSDREINKNPYKQEDFEKFARAQLQRSELLWLQQNLRTVVSYVRQLTLDKGLKNCLVCCYF